MCFCSFLIGSYMEHSTYESAVGSNHHFGRHYMVRFHPEFLRIGDIPARIPLSSLKLNMIGWFRGTLQHSGQKLAQITPKRFRKASTVPKSPALAGLKKLDLIVTKPNLEQKIPFQRLYASILKHRKEILSQFCQIVTELVLPKFQGEFRHKFDSSTIVGVLITILVKMYTIIKEATLLTLQIVLIHVFAGLFQHTFDKCERILRIRLAIIL
jgi:hypothetical protein